MFVVADRAASHAASQRTETRTASPINPPHERTHPHNNGATKVGGERLWWRLDKTACQGGSVDGRRVGGLGDSLRLAGVGVGQDI